MIQIAQQTVPVSDVLADFNEDGQLDLALVENTQNYGAAKVQVFLGTGHGTFSEPTTLRAGQLHSTEIRAADVNSDGHLDLVFSDWVAGSIYVYLGDGTGAFTPGPTLTEAELSDAITSFALGDFNHDGHLDLIVATGSNLVVFLGDGRGQFSRGWSGAESGTIVAVGDFNGDGTPDVAAGGTSAHTDIYLALADGGLVAAGNLAVQPAGLATGDFNGDGLADLVAGDSNGFEVSLAQADGGLGPLTTYPSSGYIQKGVAVVDVTGDGRPDLIAAAGYPPTIDVLQGLADGGFSPWATIPVGSVSSVPAAGDLDGDGVAEVINCSQETLEIFESGSSYFGSEIDLGPAQGLTLCDLSLTGAQDLCISGSDADGGYVLVVSGPDGGADPFQQRLIRVGATGLMESADFNHDGWPDLVVVDASGAITLLLNSTDGGLVSQRPSGASGYSPMSISVGDANGDGELDIVQIVQPFTSAEMIVCLNDGGGAFTAGPPSQFGEAFAAVVDANGDQFPDILAGGNAAEILLGQPGGFSSSASAGTPGTCQGGAVADFNDDGHVDLVVGCEASSGTPLGAYEVYLGDGDGGFGHVLPSAFTGTFPDSLVALDLDRDGATDLVTGGQGNFSFLHGRGDGTFNSSWGVETPEINRKIRLLDINGDCRWDVASLSAKYASLHAYLRLGRK